VERLSPRGLFYLAGEPSPTPISTSAWQAKLAEAEQARSTGGNVLFTSPRSPSQYATIALGIGKAGVAKEAIGRRLLSKSPLATTSPCARELIDRPARVFNESEVLRIDHYLGKETVQNIWLSFR